MKADHQIIRETVRALVQHESAESIANYINTAIGMHRTCCKNIRPTIEIDHAHIFVFYAEHLSGMIEITGFQEKEHVLDQTHKIRMQLQKDSLAIQSLLCVLYANIVQTL